jgi:hypothetical protein
MKQFKRILTHFLHDVHEHSERFSQIEQYICANPDAVDNQPTDIQDCIKKFPRLNDYYPTMESFVGPSGGSGSATINIVAGIEPKDEELQSLLTASSECAGISAILGTQYLGCDWSSPQSPMSCDCPYVTPAFLNYLSYKRLYASYYNTHLKAPLYRNALESLLNARRIKLRVRGYLNFDVGLVINIEDRRPLTKENEAITFSGFSGKWLVLNLTHVFNRDRTYETELECASYDLLIGNLDLRNPSDSSSLGIINS